MPAHHASKRALTADTGPRGLRVPLVAGAAIGVAQAATPFAFWWLAPATVYALGLVFIAAVYIGFSVADGRWKVIAAEVAVATVFVVVAAAAVTGPAWLLVASGCSPSLETRSPSPTATERVMLCTSRPAAAS